MHKGFDHIGVSVVTMCHDGKGKYLISQRGNACKDERGAWEPAGSGALEHGESLEDAVRREVKEECGAVASDITLMGFREVFRKLDGRTSHWIAFDFKAKINPNEVSITEPEKCTGLQWCTLNEIPLPQHSQFPFFLNKYKDDL
jgi:ADP-ribose pyrophosphatase YjhB (NUDIX family)